MSLASRFLSYAQYLELERLTDIRHEYFEGRVWAMAGGTVTHARLCTNVATTLHALLAGRPCAAFGVDLKVRVLATGLATYPDATVICGKLESHPEDPNAATNPLVLVEVLSDSTERFDRNEKFAHYRQIESLRAYLLVAQDTRRIEVFERNDDGIWTLREFRKGEAPIPPLDIALPLDEVYANPLPA